MTWRERLKEAAIVTPSGQRFTYDYENISEEFTKKGGDFNFPDVNGSYIQTLGNTGRRYPMRIILWGDDYDQEATAIMDALSEPGIFNLESPSYGTKNVIPLGSITRRDNLKTEGNQAVIEFVFWETIIDIYPIISESITEEIEAQIDVFNETSASAFEIKTNLETTFERVSAADFINRINKSVQLALAPIAKTIESVQREFDDISDSINDSIDTLIGDPLTMAFQVVQMIQAPARSISLASSKIEAYGNLLNDVIDSASNIFSSSYDSRPLNNFLINDLHSTGYVSGSAISALNGAFITRSEAIDAADALLQQMEDYNAWRELNYNALEVAQSGNIRPSLLSSIDTGENYEALQKLISLTARYLIDVSFSLKQEIKIIIDRPRTIIDLCAELYKSVSDESLNLLINSNNLSGSEILEIPIGKEILYYV